MNLFPAVLLGGPPHRGKSVLTYALSRALRERGVQHYVLRATPDGEGDWANEADQSLVRTLRVKGAFTPEFVAHICAGLRGRHLPLLVDVGGRPTPEQEIIFSECTHAMLLYGDEAERAWWQALLDRHNLIPVAMLRSTLDGSDALTNNGAVLQGVISHLARGTTATGPVVQALAQRLAGLFAYSPQELLLAHQRNAPSSEVYVLDELAVLLGVPQHGERFYWAPDHLRPLLDHLPHHQALALYGRGPIWVYAALAAHANPEPFWLFDVRLGWVKALRLQPGEPSPDAPLLITTHPQSDHVRLEFQLQRAYLDYAALSQLCTPALEPSKGVILSGKLPNWLWTSLVLTYCHLPWVGVYYPPLRKSIAVTSHHAQFPLIGDLLSF